MQENVLRKCRKNECAGLFHSEASSKILPADLFLTKKKTPGIAHTWYFTGKKILTKFKTDWSKNVAAYVFDLVILIRTRTRCYRDKNSDQVSRRYMYMIKPIPSNVFTSWNVDNTCK